MSELCYESIECLDCYRLTYSQDCTKCRDCHYCYQCFNCDSCFGCVALSNKKYCLFNRQLSQADYHQQLELVKQQSLDQILSQFTLLKQSTPVPQSMQRQTENCPYGDYITNCKDMYWGFNSYYVENSGYIYDSGMARDSWDTSFGGGSASGSNLQAMLSGTWQELCYEICGGSSNYHSAFLEYCSLCTNCYYSSGLSNCTDCFGCVGLKNKQSCVLNNQLTPDQYPHALAVIRSELGWPDPLP
ncbi:hypothetical protein A2W24_00325 [Microgenomates group bacterium RBG_16_45_19]|nr:MAG: hypothetical protein A2W24_00325 [Microgenomates group bacterium RBG_16_45_19]